MATSIQQLLAACSFALAAIGLCAPAAAADTQKPAKPKAAAKAKPKAKAKKVAAAAGAAAAVAAGTAAALPEDIAEPDITDTVTTEYACELGNKITIYTNVKDDAYIALRWKKRLHRLKRVGTTTGALRFENAHYGLVWIGIPTKGMLLDSKQNRQLANECKNAEQSAVVVATAAEEKKS
jgi:membrane-bound inhibitor of C-type lysozyme